jgi:hypothetical protein
MLILNNIATSNFVIEVHLHGKRCTHTVYFLNHHQYCTSRPRPLVIPEIRFKTRICNQSNSQRHQKNKFKSNNLSYPQKSDTHLSLKLQGRPIWNIKGNISMTQLDDQIEFVGEDRLQSNY